MNHLIESLHRTVFADRTDGQLLEDYISRRDAAAVAALVGRHGPMVWAVCRRLVSTHHDAEDAFQATFLVLVRRAASVRPRERVGSWLYGVARQTALKSRAIAARRQIRERTFSTLPDPAATPDSEGRLNLTFLLDEEISRLPEKYRTAIHICDLEDNTLKEAARRLGIPDGTMATRLRTARAMLAKRLARHGWPTAGGTLAMLISPAEGIPAALIPATIQAATRFAALPKAVDGASLQVAALAEGVMKAMWIANLKTLGALVLTVALATGAAGFLYQARGDQPPGPAAGDRNDRPAKAADSRTDPQRGEVRQTNSENAKTADSAIDLKMELELLEAQLVTRKAYVNLARVTVRGAEANYDLLKKAGASVTLSELVKAQFELESARAHLEIREAELNEVAVKIKYASKKAAAGQPSR